MSRKDQFHDAVKHALEKDGWLVTHDPFTIQITETVRLKIDLGAETTIAAQRDQEKIAVEIKSFITDSDISEFHTALGQYLNYIQALEEEEPDRTLHLAVPLETYNDFFQIPFVQTSLKRHAINVLIHDPIQEEIKTWKSYSNTDK
ncbi:MAG: fatty-acid oxidation protein subunit alpha [Cyanobacteria bacterium CRU_2_1]|nr:fatty-acid oxidation protein subunit alpha [Cyanobacteria bacterium RU_5_0]NJR41154.1 fatty-acid oxidation protein subunit alpha [Leptolyngbyaceae cyanobacterium CSU_1_4]NJR63101.1 fatty-acid oxidation protein subunit alpha [Cyanobacteria bacterium CRU_2_1]